MAETEHKLIFHVPPDAGPEDTLAALNTLQQYGNTAFKTTKQISELAQQNYGAGSHSNDVLKMAKVAGLLLTPKNEPISLTIAGERIVAAPSDKQVELIHYLLYTGWAEKREGELWTYRQVCDTLWEKEEVKVSTGQLASELNVIINEQFENDAAFSSAKLSVSSKTTRGVTIWLEQLHPPAIQKGVFARRSVCSRELLLLGIGWVYRDALGTNRTDGRLDSPDLPLTRERREALCKLCLLQPAALERMLNTVIATYPSFLADGTTAGAMGRFLRLYRMPSLESGGLLI